MQQNHLVFIHKNELNVIHHKFGAKSENSSVQEKL